MPTCLRRLFSDDGCWGQNDQCGDAEGSQGGHAFISLSKSLSLSTCAAESSVRPTAHGDVEAIDGYEVDLSEVDEIESDGDKVRDS